VVEATGRRAGATGSQPGMTARSRAGLHEQPRHTRRDRPTSVTYLRLVHAVVEPHGEAAPCAQGGSARRGLKGQAGLNTHVARIDATDDVDEVVTAGGGGRRVQ